MTTLNFSSLEMITSNNLPSIPRPLYRQLLHFKTHLSLQDSTQEKDQTQENSHTYALTMINKVCIHLFQPINLIGWL